VSIPGVFDTRDALLGRRYKTLPPKFQAFTREAGFLQEVVYEDKSLFKAAGPVWHPKDRLKGHLPKNLRNVDKTAIWSKSGYHGSVYGHGLPLTGIRNGFPVIFQVLPANVSERKVLDTKILYVWATSVSSVLPSSPATTGNVFSPGFPSFGTYRTSGEK